MDSIQSGLASAFNNGQGILDQKQWPCCRDMETGNTNMVMAGGSTGGLGVGASLAGSMKRTKQMEAGMLTRASQALNAGAQFNA